ncbi:MAG: NAD-dependent epimerase/dehydratase family protein [Candidatus Aenigmarchaeota archaeon]|nr:NAD-dependent epimerase/dehydratase family protein [Candidatus Aenigmarchaeota archaeon]
MKLKDSSIVVTGGAGFIGSWIAEYLRADNNVTVFDNLSTGKKGNVPNGVELINGDIRHENELIKAFKGADVVFHQAANVQIPLSIENPSFDSDVNMRGTLNVLEACRKNDVKRVVYASSSALYGNPEKIPTPEDTIPNPLSPYGLSKLTGEYYMKIYSSLYGIETVSLRYFNVYGPRQNPDSPYSGVLSVFSKNIKESRGLTVFGDGRQRRDFVSVKDVVEANILSATKDNVSGLAFNIGTGIALSLNDVISTLGRITGKNLNVIYRERRQGDAKKSCADISLAKEKLGFTPKVELEEGLRELLKS